MSVAEHKNKRYIAFNSRTGETIPNLINPRADLLAHLGAKSAQMMLLQTKNRRTGRLTLNWYVTGYVVKGEPWEIYESWRKPE